MDQDLALWNRLFQDGGIVTMKGSVPGDIEVIVEPGLGNRKYFPDPGENFVVILRGCSECELIRDESPAVQPVRDLAAVWGEPLSGRPVSYDELAHSCDMWWQAWKEGNQL